MALGEGVGALSLGQRVAVLSYHAYATHDLAEASAVVPLPAEMAADFPGEPLGCAMNVFERSAIEPDQVVCVIGLGFLGALLVQLASGAGTRNMKVLMTADTIGAGYAPSVRLFEAAACGTPVISDWWQGLDELFTPEKEILISRSPQDTLRYLQEIGEPERREIAAAARRKVLANHSCQRRAAELEQYVANLTPVNGSPHSESARGQQVASVKSV